MDQLTLSSALLNWRDLKLGERIAALRKRYGESRNEFSDRVGVTDRTLRNYENSITCPTIEHLCAICKTPADLCWLLTGEMAGIEIGTPPKTAAKSTGTENGAITEVYFSHTWTEHMGSTNGKIHLFPADTLCERLYVYDTSRREYNGDGLYIIKTHNGLVARRINAGLNYGVFVETGNHRDELLPHTISIEGKVIAEIVLKSPE